MALLCVVVRDVWVRALVAEDHVALAADRSAGFEVQFGNRKFRSAA
jgi:hypothetical protein